ncbi:MAG: isoprenylcysteine carboxylmethyltransferase family protein [Verrucomicrobia bacterium]|nr:MAG: isoprenylcysteine carboxylmethyltransferase family protein [Verrucomicrobiota bacterium]
MSRSTTAILPLAVPAGVGAIIFASAGRWDLPFVWAILGLLGAFYLALAAFADPSMMRERLAPGPGNRDRLTRLLGGGVLVGHWVLAGLDVGRFQWSLIPWQVQLGGVAGYAAALGVLFWAMQANPFYSSVVRLQADRGHHTVAAGPYRFVRHPGYAATLFAMLSGGVALGSGLAMLPILVFFGLFVRRTLLEDRLLRQELEGYAEYAQKVRYRLIVGLF